MRVRILGWRYKNIRGLRDLRISLDDPPPQWTLIQMPNGTGKTTTLTLMRVALSGESMSESMVRSFRPDDQTAAGEFELHLGVEGEQYRRYLSFDFESGAVLQATSSAAVASGGREPGNHLKPMLRNLLTPEFTRLFIFDGELARSIRDINRDEASRAIQTLYRLDRLELLQAATQRNLEREQEARAKTEKGLVNVAGRLKTAEATLETLRERRENFENAVVGCRNAIEKLKAQKEARIAVGDDTRRRMEQVTVKLGDIKERIANQVNQILSTTRNPAAVANRIRLRLSELGSRLQLLKLPKTTSAEFFREIAAASRCICGRPIGEAEREVILSRSTRYLAENEVGVINAMKDALRRTTAEPSELSARVVELSNSLINLKRANHERDQIEVERERSGGPEIETFNNQLGTQERALRDADAELRRLTTTSRLEQQEWDVSWKNNIPICEAEVDDKREAHAKATKTLRLLKQSKYVQELLRKIESQASTKLRHRVQDRTNAKLDSLLPGEHIVVSKIGNSLQLASKDMRIKESVSEGQSLAVAYAFLASLFQDAPYRFPFVVDSPAVPLDTRVRREVADLIPGLFEQVIFFVISSEREGFADSFYERKGTRFLTIETERGGATKALEGVDAFRTFHSDEDEANQESNT